MRPALWLAAGMILSLVAGCGGATPAAPLPPRATVHYTAPGGTSTGDGTFGRPWDLATALAGAQGAVQPGDTVWVRGGTYPGTFTSALTGTSAAPIIVRQYPGERAVLDGDGSSNTL